LGALLKNCTELKLPRQGYVYESSSKGVPLRMHEADNGTLALFKVYRCTLGKTKQFRRVSGNVVTCVGYMPFLVDGIDVLRSILRIPCLPHTHPKTECDAMKKSIVL
jgi:hypothetical protein